MTPTAADIIAAARETLGTPFRHQGRRAGQALDCAGVICHVCDRLGVPYAAPLDYPRRPYAGQLEAVLNAQPALSRVPGEPQPGDILLMRFARDPQHLGIWTGETLIHSWESAGKVAEHGMDDDWRRRIVAVYRIRGLA